MRVTGDLLRKIAATCPADRAAAAYDWIAEELGGLQETAAAVRHAKEAGRREAARHADELGRIAAALAAAQAGCPHYETTYHGDPAGGSASHTTCDLCGKEL